MRFRCRNLRSLDSGEFEYVRVNQDGSVRELSPKEKEYLNTEFSVGDGAAPYIKFSYKSRDGWGSISGFLPREKVPTNIVIEPVNPQYDSLVANRPIEYFKEQILEEHRISGDIIETHPDGSVTCTPNPNISRKERFKIMQRARLER